MGDSESELQNVGDLLVLESLSEMSLLWWRTTKPKYSQLSTLSTTAPLSTKPGMSLCRLPGDHLCLAEVDCELTFLTKACECIQLFLQARCALRHQTEIISIQQQRHHK